MAALMGIACEFGIPGGRFKGKRRKNGVILCPSASLMDQYRTLRIEPGASEKEVKKAFRRLALQYHPDVCKGSSCGVQFHQINEAYDMVMTSLREANSTEVYESFNEEGIRGMNEPSWDLWEEWMGWEGAGIRDYSSHINPYI